MEFAGALSTPLVGREAEARELEGRLRSGRLVIIQGPPGEGKSRLAAELVRRLHEKGLIAKAREVNLGGWVGGWGMGYGGPRVKGAARRGDRSSQAQRGAEPSTNRGHRLCAL